MSKQILRALHELLHAGIIDQATAERIKTHYENQDDNSPNRLLIVFGILGGLLVGLGIILILAHNWDDLSRTMKVIIGVFPLLTGQVLTGILLFRGVDNRTWREGTATFLICSIGVSIAIVSQAYNLGGELADFLLVWACLAVPVIYVLRSGTAAMLCIAIITWHACELSYFSYLGSRPAPLYWAVIAAILPFLYFVFVQPQRKNNFYVVLSWLLVLSLTICLATVAENTGRLFFIAYISMFSTFVMAGESDLFRTGRVLSNALLVTGSLGVVAILLGSSFVDFWDWGSSSDDPVYNPLGITVIALSVIIAVSTLVAQVKAKGLGGVNAKAFAFVFFICVYIVGVITPALGMLLVNIGVLLLALYTIRTGARMNHLGILNYGLLIIAALILCRFFDTDLSFVVRGMLFIAVGAGFFVANYYLVKQRKSNR